MNSETVVTLAKRVMLVPDPVRREVKEEVASLEQQLEKCKLDDVVGQKRIKQSYASFNRRNLPLPAIPSKDEEAKNKKENWDTLFNIKFSRQANIEGKLNRFCIAAFSN